MMRTTFLALCGAFALSACASGPSTSVSTPPATGAAQPQLSGTTWRIVSISGQAVPQGGNARAAQMSFTDGRISASAGCNIMGGAYTLTGNTLRAGQMTSTMMACQGAMEHEARLGQILAQSLTVLQTPNGDMSLTAEDGAKIMLRRS